MKSTLVFSTCALATSGLLAACFYEVGDLTDPGDGGSGGASSVSSNGSGGAKVGGASGSGAETGASSSASASSASASSAASGGGGGSGSGGEGGAPALPFLSCRQDAAYYGVCGGDGGQVLVWITEVPVEVQNACGDPQAPNPRCLVRHCTEEAAGPCGETAECGRSGVSHGLTCLGAPADPTFVHECSTQGPQCIGNVALKPDPADAKNCLFRDCAADGLTCTVAAGDVKCAP
jgi:hypothetical protein